VLPAVLGNFGRGCNAAGHADAIPIEMRRQVGYDSGQGGATAQPASPRSRASAPAQVSAESNGSFLRE